MRLPALLLTAALVGVPAVAAGAGYEELVAAGRDYAIEEVRSRSRNQKSLQSFLDALRLNPDGYEANWRGARAALYLWRLSDDKAEKARLSKVALELTARAIRANPEGAEGWLFAGIARQSYAADQGVLNVLRQAPEVRELLETATRLEPAAFRPVAHARLALTYHLLPGFPLSYGNQQKALEHIEMALETRAEGPVNLVYKADILRTLGRFDEALATLAKIDLKSPVPARAPRDFRESAYFLAPLLPQQVKAIEMLAKAGVKRVDVEVFSMSPAQLAAKYAGGVPPL